MAKFRAFSRGTQIVLVTGPLLLLSLFFTWQNVDIDYGPAGVAATSLDGWDAWGLLLALLVLSATAIVGLANLTAVEMSDDIPWQKITLVLGAGIFAVALLKNLTDASSSWASYGFVALAALFAVGSYLDWAAARREHKPLLTQKRRGLRSAA